MQNFGGGGGGGGGGPQQQQQQMYGGGGPPTVGGGPPQMQQNSLFAYTVPQPTGLTPQHHNQYKMALKQFQHNRTQVLQQAFQQGQMTMEQFSAEMHQVNEKIHIAYSKYQQQLQQAQQRMQQHQQQGGPGGPGGPSSSSSSSMGQMPPPQMPPPTAGMTAAEKKKMMEMQKQRNLMAQQQQQQQAQGMRFPPGTSLQQQQQQMRMYQQQQQQQQQQNAQNPGYRGMGGGAPSGGPGYPMGTGGPMGGMGMGGPQGGPHMQPQTPQSHGGGPGSVSSSGPGSVQSQQFQQQQYYQQQQHQNQQMQQQQHMQHPGQQQQQHQQHMQQQQQQMMQQQHMQQQQQHQVQQQHQQSQQGGPAHFQQQQAPPPQQAQAPPPPPAEKPEDVKYHELLKELRTQYYEVLKGMQKRNSQQRGMVQMIEILDGERRVPYEQLVGLAPSLQRLMIRDCPTFPLMDRMRQILFKKKEDRDKAMQTLNFVDHRENLSAAAEKASARLSAKCTDRDPFGVAPWRSVRHMTIRVPDHVRALYEKKPKTEEGDSKTEDVERTKTKKRQRDGDDEADVGKKRKKEETSEQDEIPEEDPCLVDDRFLIKPLFDTRKPWIIPPKARDELALLSNWSIDEHCLPSCSTAPFIIISIKSPFLLVNPLRVCLSRDYPATPITVQFDRSFPETSEYGATLQKLYERNLAARTAPSLTDFVEVWNTACEEYQIFVQNSPSSQSQAGFHGSNRSTVTPAAQKGIAI